MNIVGQIVRHKQFGEGTVQTQDGGMVGIDFQQAGEKRFLYPQSFESHLTLADTALQNKIQAEISALQEAKRQEQEARRLEQRQREEELQQLAETKTRKRPAAKRTAAAT